MASPIVHGKAVVPISIEAAREGFPAGSAFPINHTVLNEVQSASALMARDFSAINPTVSPVVNGQNVSANAAVIGISELHFKINGRHAIAKVDEVATRFTATSGQGAIAGEFAYDGTISFITDLGFEGQAILKVLANPATGKFQSLYRNLKMVQGAVLVGLVLDVNRYVPPPAPTPAPTPAPSP